MLTVVVGGFFGDEGKGKITAYLGLADNIDVAIRCGAINAGHTVTLNGRTWKLRIIPSAFVNRNAKLMIAPGALIRLDVLFKEIEETGTKDRIFIDSNTGIIEQHHVEAERRDAHLSNKVGSTLQGVGAAMSDRVLRRLRMAHELEKLKEMITDVPAEVDKALREGLSVLIEGTQGAYLSLYHGTYPYVTSRDTTASAFASEVGIGPKKVDEVLVVFKVYITRVGQGPLEGELLPEESYRRGWNETATVTGRRRRTAPFNVNLAKRAVMLNSATQVAITKLDVLYPQALGIREWEKLPYKARRWIEEIESEIRAPVTLIGTGPEANQVIDKRKELGFLR